MNGWIILDKPSGVFSKSASNRVARIFGTKKNGENYYAFLNAKSVNIGEYSKKSPHSENAFELMKYALGK